MKNYLFSFLAVLFIVFLGSTTSVYAQNNAALTGKVIDGKTHETLPGANIYFEGTTIGGVTDANGKFYVSNIPAGDYTLKVSYIGYETYQETITFKAGETVTKSIKLGYAGAKNLETVEITAQAKGQMAAINQQLSSSDLRNVVSSDRIQELPDANVSESVGRLPGVSIQRSGGEGNKVVIRGLSPKYNKVTIDGMEMSSTNAEDRSTSLSMISSYSLDGIEVIKSNTADHDGDFVGGSVNFKLKTAEKGFHTDIVALGAYNQLKNSFKNYQFVASVGDRFFNDKLGIFIMGNAESRIRSADEREVDTWFASSNPSITEPNPLWPANLRLNSTHRTRKRYGGTLVVDYQLNHGSITLSNFVSSGQDKVQKYTQHYNVDESIVTFDTQDGNYDILTINNLLKYEQQFGSFKVYANIGHSFSKNYTPNDLSLNFLEWGALPGIPKNDPSLNPDSIVDYHKYDPANMYARTFNSWERETKQNQYEASADLEWFFKISDNVTGVIKVGGKYRHKNKNNVETRWFGDVSESTDGGAFNRVLLNQFPQMKQYVDDPATAIRIPFAAYMDYNYVPGKFMKGEYGDIMRDVADIPFMHEVWDFVSDTAQSHPSAYVYRRDDPDSKQFNYDGVEDLYAGYIMATFKITSYVDFIPGFRYESNNTSYTGPHGDMRATDPTRIKYGDYKQVTTDRSNGFFLPMIHLKLKPLSWLQAHFAYTKTLARPNFTSLVPKQHIESGMEGIVIQHRWDLKPEISENIDVNISVHENHVGLFSAGFFSKNIHDKIFWTGKRLIGDDYEKYGLDQTLQSYSINTQYNDTTVVKIRGFELDWQTSFWYLPGALKGLVLNINYTHIKSEAQYPYTIYRTVGQPPFQHTEVIDTAYHDRLIDQPNDIFNISLGYDYKGFSARISMMYTDDVFSNTNRYNDLKGYKGKYIRWDASVKQKLPVKGLQIFLNLNNISGTIDKYYVRGASYPVNEQYYGMTADLGLRWKL